MNPMPDSFFRTLSAKQAAQFRRWAREHYFAHCEIPEIWHPVVRDECRRINAEDSSLGLMASVQTPHP